MAEKDTFTEQVKENPLVLLDVTNDIEQIPIGPDEKERNESRLRKVITGEKRPASHTAKEAVAWGTSNLALPLLVAFVKGGGTVAKGAKGLKEISKFSKEGRSVQQAAKAAERAANKAVKETGKKVAQKDAKLKSKKMFDMFINLALDNEPTNIAHRAAKENKKNVDTAIKALNHEASKPLPMDMVKDLAVKNGAKAMAGTMATTKAGNVVARGVPNSIDIEEGARKNDPRAERYDFKNSPLKTIGNLGKDAVKLLFDFDDLDPHKYPMDLVSKVLVQTNADADLIDSKQLDRLNDREKVKLVKDIMKGKYNDFEDVSQIMLRNYLDLTNNDEE